MSRLLSETEMQEKLRVRGRVGFVFAAAIILLTVGLFVGVIWFQHWLALIKPVVEAQYGEAGFTLLRAAPFAYYLVLLFGMGALSEPWLEKTKLTCMHCGEEMRWKSVKTRRCERCGEQAIEGKTRSDAVFKRYSRWKSNAGGSRMLWGFPVITLVAMFLLAPEFGVFASIGVMPVGGMILIRYRYRPVIGPMLASLVLFVIGVVAIIRSWP